MLDARARLLLTQPLDRAAERLDRRGVTPDRLTLAGLAVGLGAAIAAAQAWWAAALGMWLVSRLLDGLDGPLARRRCTSDRGAGGFLDIMADFTVYGAFVIGVAVGSGQSLLPFLAVLFAYYINGSAFLAFSSIAERTGRRIDDGRSLSFLGGLAEGTETIAVHALWCLVPAYAGTIAWVWAGIVLVSATQRIVGGFRSLDSGPRTDEATRSGPA
ncbi:MAG: CDP-alcohol phosphatidyltransferase family protein [Actinomycetales bacterium]|nr:CDP-alcohol phosphatidyltransferase family protein [Actinomycetales bacterium]